MKHPSITTVRSVCEAAQENAIRIGDRWVPARPEGYASLRHRLRAAWLVFTGRADALVWPEDEEPRHDR